MDEIAYAKINLALRVSGKRDDGYHDIDTLFAFAEEGDRLSVAEGDELELSVIGPFAGDLDEAGDNLVMRAARLLDPGRGARLTLDKRLPVASGIGGGSADAAATLRLLVRWWELGLGTAELLALARRLGADVPACLLARTVRGTGRGDLLEPAQAEVAGKPLLLVNPRVALSTAEVFSRWRGVPTDGNDLEPAALELAPAVGEVLGALRACRGVELARMSGSGATCFALFGSEANRDSAAEAIASERPYWWQLATRLR